MRTKIIAGALVSLIVLGAIAWVAWRGLSEREAASPTPPSILKIGFSTDWEYGSRKRLEHKLPIQGLPELEKVVASYNDVFKPDLVIGGGDYIESSATKPEKAKLQLAEINAVFNKLTMPHYYALGNHDMRSLTKGEVMSIIGITESHTIID